MESLYSMDQRSQRPDNVKFYDAHPNTGDSASEILTGLQASNKTIDPKWFYDAAGSLLFEQITELPEYYPTRTEISILKNNRTAISACCGNDCILIEPGSGNCEKVRLLLDDLRPSAYVPMDISADFLNAAAEQLGHEYPWLSVHAVCTDFSQNWQFAGHLPAGRRVVFYPGSTIGNLEPTAAGNFLRRVRQLIGGDGGLLIGVDLHKSTDRLNAAYNDASGITARFNLNVLNHINQLLDADFDTGCFTHRAFYNTSQRRIEMHLVSQRAQTVRCADQLITFAEGESIHTENSYKYTVDDFTSLAVSSGLIIHQSWLDEEQLFSIHYLKAN